jgi:hypothetical protein
MMRQPAHYVFSGGVFVFALICALYIDPAWYRYLIPGGLFLVCWIMSRFRMEIRFFQLICGLTATIAVWSVSPFFGVLSLCPVCAIFLMQNHALVSREDWIWFSLFSGMAAFSALLMLYLQHTLIPAVLAVIGAVVVFVGIRVALYRMAWEFRSDHS